MSTPEGVQSEKNTYELSAELKPLVEKLTGLTGLAIAKVAQRILDGEGSSDDITDVIENIKDNLKVARKSEKPEDKEQIKKMEEAITALKDFRTTIQAQPKKTEETESGKKSPEEQNLKNLREQQENDKKIAEALKNGINALKNLAQGLDDKKEPASDAEKITELQTKLAGHVGKIIEINGERYVLRSVFDFNGETPTANLVSLNSKGERQEVVYIPIGELHKEGSNLVLKDEKPTILDTQADRFAELYKKKQEGASLTSAEATELKELATEIHKPVNRAALRGSPKEPVLNQVEAVLNENDSNAEQEPLTDAEKITELQTKLAGHVGKKITFQGNEYIVQSFSGDAVNLTKLINGEPKGSTQIALADMQASIDALTFESTVSQSEKPEDLFDLTPEDGIDGIESIEYFMRESLANYITAYKNYYDKEKGQEGWIKKAYRKFTTEVGFFGDTDDALSFKGELGETLKATKTLYEEARAKYEQSVRGKVNDLDIPDETDAEKIKKKKEEMMKRFIGLEKVASREKALQDARTEAFNTRFNKIMKAYTDLPWPAKVIISSAVIGGGMVALTTAISGGSLVAAAGSTAFLGGRALAGTATGKYLGQASKWLAEKVGADAEMASKVGATIGAGSATAVKLGMGGGIGIVGGFLGQGLVRASRKAFNKWWFGKTNSSMRKELEREYEAGEISYKEYEQGIKELERTSRKADTAQTVAGYAGAALGGGLTAGGVFENNDGDTDIPETKPEPTPEPTPEPVPADKPTPEPVPEPKPEDEPVPKDEPAPKDEDAGDKNKDENNDPVPKNPEWKDVNELSKVLKEDGVTQIMQRQLDADSDLIKAAEEKLGIKYADNKALFLKNLAQEFGYINENGDAQVWLRAGENNAYDLEIKNGNLVINEWENGAFGETRTLGSGFEPTTDGIDKGREMIPPQSAISQEKGGGYIDENLFKKDAGAVDPNLFKQNTDSSYETGKVDSNLFKDPNRGDTDPVVSASNTGYETGKVDPNEVFTQHTRLSDLPYQFQHLGAQPIGDALVRMSDDSYQIGAGAAPLEGYLNELVEGLKEKGIEPTEVDPTTKLSDLEQMAFGEDAPAPDTMASSTDTASKPTEETPSAVTAMNQGQVLDFINNTKEVTADDIISGLEYFKSKIPQSVFEAKMNVTVERLNAVPDSDTFDGLLAKFANRVFTDTEINPDPNSSILSALNLALTRTGSSTTVETIAYAN